jgi:guanylate kinase
MTQGRPSRRADAITRRGIMLVISSPSGAGKTALTRKLLERDPGITLSISVTTRAPRTDEVHGRDYHFVDAAQFEAMRAGGELLEWAFVFDNWYGTPRGPVEEAIASGRDVLFDIDWQGTQKLREKLGPDLVSVFVLPPSVQELERRLHSRGRDSDAVIAGRMAKAHDEMSHWAEYEYVVINRDLHQAFAEIQAILVAERLKRGRQTGLSTFVRSLQAKM